MYRDNFDELFLFLVSSVFQHIVLGGGRGGGHGSCDFLVQGDYSHLSIPPQSSKFSLMFVLEDYIT